MKLTNIIRDIINDDPSISESAIRLVCERKEAGEFIVSPEINNNILIVVRTSSKASLSVEEFKRNMVADHIYMATQDDCCDKNHNNITMDILADIIDEIINAKVFLW